MSKLDNIKNDIGTRVKSLLGTVADILETITKQNLAFASDFAGFAVAQVRLPTESNDLGDYRSRSKDAYSAFGGTLKAHGKDLIAVLREVPSQVKAALTVEEKAAKKAAPKAEAAESSEAA